MLFSNINDITNNKYIIESLSDFEELQNFQIEWGGECIYIADEIFNSGIIEKYRMLFNSILEIDLENDEYTRQVAFIDWKRYIVLEKYSILQENIKNILLDVLKEEFWDELVSVWSFWSYITKEDWLYSDYDLIIILNSYEDDNIYEREKKSPKIKKILKEKWISQLFTFNFYTRNELENASINNPFLLESFAKSFTIFYDNKKFLEKTLLKNRNIEYLWNFCWKWEILNSSQNIERLLFIKEKLEQVLQYANEYENWLQHHYLYELEKINIMIQILSDKNIFIWRFDFNKVFNDLVKLDEEELEYYYWVYKKASIAWKRSLLDYWSVNHNIIFSNVLLENWLELPWLLHRYLALKNIMLELLHKSGNFIIDWEVTQKFLHIFWDNLWNDINHIFYDYVFKTEQVLWRTWFLSFDFNSDWSYIFESGGYNYKLLLSKLDYLIDFFIRNKDELLRSAWEVNTDIYIFTKWNNIDIDNFIFPSSIKMININSDLWHDYKNGYTFVLNSNNNFPPDYLIKCLAWFNSNKIKVVSWNRISKHRKWNTYHNFVFRNSDFVLEKNGIFNYKIRNFQTEYFTS